MPTAHPAKHAPSRPGHATRPRKHPGTLPASAVREVRPLTAADIMTEDPVVIDVNATVRDAVSTLANLDIRHLPVMERNQLVGMVSDRDLHTSVWVEPGEGVPRLQRPVSSIMNTAVVSVGPDAELGEIVDVLLEQRVGAVPVVDEHQGDLVGIVSQVDVLRALAEAL